MINKPYIFTTVQTNTDDAFRKLCIRMYGPVEDALPVDMTAMIGDPDAGDAQEACSESVEAIWKGGEGLTPLSLDEMQRVSLIYFFNMNF